MPEREKEEPLEMLENPNYEKDVQFGAKVFIAFFIKFDRVDKLSLL